MQTFSGYQYLLIDIANCFGHDKLSWNDRIAWTTQRLSKLESLDSDAAYPILFRKAVRALREAEKGNPVNHVMGLDATASGIQCMAAMSGCESSMRAVNLINTGQREDLYLDVANHMTRIINKPVPRSLLKKPTMTFFYGSKAQPEKALGTGEGLKAFYSTLKTVLNGPYHLMKLFQGAWDPTATHYHWFMPDGHHVFIPVTKTVDRRLEIDEADHLRCTYRSLEVSPVEKGRSLAANITHSVDAYICRQLVLRCKKVGVQVATIHDCFYAHPNNMNTVRQVYLDLMMELADSNMVQGILKQILGRSGYTYSKINPSISPLMKDAEYALS